MGQVEEKGQRLPMVSQDKAIAHLHETISVLYDRLGSILTPEPVSDLKEGAEQALPDQSPLANQLEINNQDIHRATRRLQSLIERAEC